MRRSHHALLVRRVAMNGGRSKASDGAIVAASLYTTVQLPSFRKLENDVALSNEYVAGLLDGEGSIGLYRDVRVPNTYKPKICIQLRDEVGTASVLSELCCRYGVRLQRNRRGMCAFSLYRATSLKQFIDDVLPYTRLKTTQLILLWAWLETRTFNYRFHQLLKNHKQRRIK